MKKIMELTKNETQALADDLQCLREKLDNETNIASRLREAYGAECGRLDNRGDASALAAKQRLDVALSRIERMRTDISQKERELDEFQGREAEETRRKEAQRNFELASVRLASCQAELAKLKAEHGDVVEKIRLAEWRFNEALRLFNKAREQHVAVV